MCNKGVTRKGRQFCAVFGSWAGGGRDGIAFLKCLLCAPHLTSFGSHSSPIREMRRQSPSLWIYTQAHKTPKSLLLLPYPTI